MGVRQIPNCESSHSTASYSVYERDAEFNSRFRIPVVMRYDIRTKAGRLLSHLEGQHTGTIWLRNHIQGIEVQYLGDQILGRYRYLLGGGSGESVRGLMDNLGPNYSQRMLRDLGELQPSIRQFSYVHTLREVTATGLLVLRIELSGQSRVPGSAPEGDGV